MAEGQPQTRWSITIYTFAGGIPRRHPACGARRCFPPLDCLHDTLQTRAVGAGGCRITGIGMRLEHRRRRWTSCSSTAWAPTGPNGTDPVNELTCALGVSAGQHTPDFGSAQEWSQALSLRAQGFRRRSYSTQPCCGAPLRRGEKPPSVTTSTQRSLMIT
jgi:hypothetical protein